MENARPFVKQFSNPGLKTLYLICDGNRADQIMEASPYRCNDSLCVDLIMNNNQFKPFIRNNNRYQELATSLAKRKIPLATFVYVFVYQRDLPGGHHVKAINTFDADVRFENLMVSPGRGGNKRIDLNIIPQPILDLGVNLLPYRVRAVEDNNKNGRISIYAINVDGTRKTMSYTQDYRQAISRASDHLIQNYSENGLDYNAINALFNNMVHSRQEILGAIE